MVDLKVKARSLPLAPGVYIMLDKQGKVLYVGKAKQLKNRVSSYFQDSAGHTKKTRELVKLICDFDTIIAGSEFEALVLECSLIKRHQPKFNILLKDGKGYPFIRLAKGESYARFHLAGKAMDDGARYFGPYAGRAMTQKAIDALTEALRLPLCEKVFPRDFGKERPCLQYHMNRCLGVCRGTVSETEYASLLQQAAQLLEGKFGHVTEKLKAEMEQAAEDLLFERAAQLRDRIVSIEKLSRKQIVVSGSMADTDVLGFHEGSAKNAVAVLHYKEGQLFSRDVELFEELPEGGASELLAAFMKQYYPNRRSFPQSILLPMELEETDILQRLISEKAGRKVDLSVPKRGDKAELCRLASKNAEEEVERVTTREERDRKLITALQELLRLDHPPRRIEACDISNTGSDQRVGAVTVFVDGRPLKRDYRLFAIQDKAINDDFHAMQEVLSRRFKRMLAGDEKFIEPPDLLLADGGAVHASMMTDVLRELGVDIPVFGMVKDNRHRTRGLVTPDGAEIGLSAIPAIFALIGQIQEETHRFAITFHQKKRGQSQIQSELDSIPGVGKARRAALLNHFKSLKKIKTATADELTAVVPKDCAQAVFAHFHPKEGTT